MRMGIKERKIERQRAKRNARTYTAGQCHDMGRGMATMIAAVIILPGLRFVQIHGRINRRRLMVFVAMAGIGPRHAAYEREDDKPDGQEAFE